MDCLEFCRRVLKDHRGEPLCPAAMHVLWQRHVEYCWVVLRKHPVILAPWGHGKTVQVAVCRVLFELGRNADLRVKLVCNSRRAALGRLALLRQYVEFDEDLHDVFPQLVRPERGSGLRWSEKELWLKGSAAARRVDASVRGEGILSTGIGDRADLIVFDDVVDRRNALDQPRLREKVTENFFETWLSRLDGAAGRSVTIMTLWHREDLGHRLLANGEFCVLRMAVNEELDGLVCELAHGDGGHPLWRMGKRVDGERVMLPLWEERWPRSALLRKRREHRRAFERGFQLKAFAREDVLFPSFKKCYVDLRREEVLSGRE